MGKAETFPGPIPAELWVRHLSGDSIGVGIIPLRSDDTCLWGAVDIDDYSIDSDKLVEDIRKANIPFIPCRTKSGGIHLYVFFTDPEPAELVRNQLEAWAALLGYGGSEIFPKQSSRAGNEDIGNWINIPYFGETRRALNHLGKEISLEEFVTLAEKKSTSLEEAPWEGLETDESSFFVDGPPCLQMLEAKQGFPSGTRNEGMFSVAVYLKKRFGDDWQKHLSEYNVRMCDPPLEPREVAIIAKSVSKKEYGYRCKQAPIAQYCRKRECLRRKFGVGRTDAGVEILGLTFYRTSPSDPVSVGFEIAGQRYVVPSETFFSITKFNQWAWAQLGTIVSSLNQARWQARLVELGEVASVVQLPEDAGETGLVWAHVENFLSQRAQAKTLDEVVLGKPFRDEDRTWFLLVSLSEYLKARKVGLGGQRELTQLLRSKGADKAVKLVAGKQKNVWHLPMTEEEPEPMNVEENREKEAF